MAAPTRRISRKKLEEKVHDDAVPSKDFIIDYVADSRFLSEWGNSETRGRILSHSPNSDESMGLYMVSREDLQRGESMNDAIRVVNGFDLDKRVVIFSDAFGTRHEETLDRAFFEEKYHLFYPSHKKDFERSRWKGGKILDLSGITRQMVQQRHAYLWNNHFGDIIRDIEFGQKMKQKGMSKVNELAAQVDTEAIPSQDFIVRYIFNTKPWRRQRSLRKVLDSRSDTPDRLGLYIVNKLALKFDDRDPSHFLEEIHSIDADRKVVITRDARGRETEQAFDEGFFERNYVFYPDIGDINKRTLWKDGKLTRLDVNESEIRKRHTKLWELYFDPLVNYEDKLGRGTGIRTGIKPFLITMLFGVASTVIGGAAALFTKHEMNPTGYERERFEQIYDESREVKREKMAELIKELVEATVEKDKAESSYKRAKAAAMASDEPFLIIDSNDNYFHSINPGACYRLEGMYAVGPDEKKFPKGERWHNGNRLYNHRIVLRDIVDHILKLGPNHQPQEIWDGMDNNPKLFYFDIPDLSGHSWRKPFKVLVRPELMQTIAHIHSIGRNYVIADRKIKQKENAIERLKKFVRDKVEGYEMPE